MNHIEILNGLLNNNAVSFRLKNSLREYNNADPVDALRDAQELMFFLTQKMSDLKILYNQQLLLNKDDNVNTAALSASKDND